jgi:hypothetical protein
MAAPKKKAGAVLSPAKHDALIKAVWPSVSLTIKPIAGAKVASDYLVVFNALIVKVTGKKDRYILQASVEEEDTNVKVASTKLDIEPADIKKYESGAITLDQFLSDSSVSGVPEMCREVLDLIIEDIPKADVESTYKMWSEDPTTLPKMQPYTKQEFFDDKGKRIKDETFLNSFLPAGEVEIPAHFRVKVPKDIIIDKVFTKRAETYILDGASAVGFVGPTGAGKSHLARYIAGSLEKYGYGAIVIDANGRLQGDRLFERDDFNEEGTFILEGVLLKAARDTAKLGIKLLVITEEWNAFNDKTRREFYRLLNDRDRVYDIMSTKDSAFVDTVDFSHVQFLLTANPMTDQYVTDDLQPLSAAEQRRITSMYLDYPKSPAQLAKIMKCIVEARPNFGRLGKNKPSYNYAVKLFQLIHSTDGQGVSLGFDAGYTPVASCAFWAAVHGNSPEAWKTAIHDFIITKITDISIREVIAQRVDTELGIKIPAHMVKQGV